MIITLTQDEVMSLVAQKVREELNRTNFFNTDVDRIYKNNENGITVELTILPF